MNRSIFFFLPLLSLTVATAQKTVFEMPYSHGTMNYFKAAADENGQIVIINRNSPQSDAHLPAAKGGKPVSYENKTNNRPNFEITVITPYENDYGIIYSGQEKEIPKKIPIEVVSDQDSFYVVFGSPYSVNPAQFDVLSINKKDGLKTKKSRFYHQYKKYSGIGIASSNNSLYSIMVDKKTKEILIADLHPNSQKEPYRFRLPEAIYQNIVSRNFYDGNELIILAEGTSAQTPNENCIYIQDTCLVLKYDQLDMTQNQTTTYFVSFNFNTGKAAFTTFYNSTESFKFASSLINQTVIFSGVKQDLINLQFYNFNTGEKSAIY